MPLARRPGPPAAARRIAQVCESGAKLEALKQLEQRILDLLSGRWTSANPFDKLDFQAAEALGWGRMGRRHESRAEWIPPVHRIRRCCGADLGGN